MQVLDRMKEAMMVAVESLGGLLVYFLPALFWAGVAIGLMILGLVLEIAGYAVYIGTLGFLKAQLLFDGGEETVASGRSLWKWNTQNVFAILGGDLDDFDFTPDI